MGLIKDSNKYPYKETPVGDDYLIGSDSAQNGKTINFKLSAIKSYVGSGGTSSDLGDRNKGAGTSAPPADQEILYNNASAASTTSIFIDDNDLDGSDRSASIAKSTSGILTISDKENGEDNYDKFEISGLADNTGYFTFTVTWLESKGTVSGEVNVGVDISGSGGGAVSSVFGRTGAVVATSGDYEASEVTNAFDKSADDEDDIQNKKEYIVVACSDETSNLTTGTNVAQFRMPFAATITEVRAEVNTAPVDSPLLVDINEGGISILSTKLSIDSGETTSETAVTPPVISDSNIAENAILSIDIDQVGSSTAGAGLKVTLICTR